MNKEIEKYVGLYLLVYVTVLAICGFFQYIVVCQGKTLECAFSMSKINTIITTTAYVLGPLVVVFGFVGWKSQHNKTLLAIEAKDFIKTINKDIFALSCINIEVKNIRIDEELLIQLKEFNEILNQFENLSELQNEITTKSGLFRNLSGDEKLFEKVQKYQKFISDMFIFASNPNTVENIDSSIFKKTMLTNIRNVIIFNGEIIRDFKSYIILE